MAADPRTTRDMQPAGVDTTQPEDRFRRRARSGTIARAADGTYSTEPCSLEGLTVLVVDDHEDTRVMFAEYLGWHGARPIPVDGVTQAIIVLEAIAVDVVITDVAMPWKDGYELIARMDAHPVWASIPRVIASGQSCPEEASDRAPSAVYLCKPVALDDLVRAVERAHGVSCAEGRSGAVGGL